MLFPSGGILVMLLRWPSSSNSTTSIASPVAFRTPRSGASTVILMPWLSPCAAAEKNGLLRLRASVLDPLRPAAAAGPRSLLWRQACLSRVLLTQGPMSAVRWREDRTVGLARRQSLLYQALRLLRGPSLPRNPHQGSGRGTLSPLADGQGSGQAVHAGTTPPGRHSRSPGHRHRRDRHCQGAPVPHRGQRLGARPAHLVRRPGPLR